MLGVRVTFCNEKFPQSAYYCIYRSYVLLLVYLSKLKRIHCASIFCSFLYMLQYLFQGVYN